MAPVLRSRIDPADEVFTANRDLMLAALAEIDELTARVVGWWWQQ